MSHGTAYTITLAQLEELADIACRLDDRDIIPLDSARKSAVGDIHSLVERIVGPDAHLIYNDPEAA